MIPLLLTLTLLGQSSGGGGLRRVTTSGPITGTGTAASPVTCRDASGAQSGCVTTGAQSFAGVKTFNNQVVVTAGSGGTNAIVFGASGTGLYSGGFAANDFSIFTGGGTRWGWGNGNFLAGSNNAYDIGSTAIRFQRIWLGTLGVNLDFTDSTASPGAATINKSSGSSAMASGAGTVMITSSTAAAASRIFVQPTEVDAGCTQAPWIVTKAAGSFTVSTADATTCIAATNFDWFIIQ